MVRVFVLRIKPLELKLCLYARTDDCNWIRSAATDKIGINSVTPAWAEKS